MNTLHFAKTGVVTLMAVALLGACKGRDEATPAGGAGGTATSQGRDAANTAGGAMSGSGTTSSTSSATATGPNATASAASR